MGVLIGRAESEYGALISQTQSQAHSWNQGAEVSPTLIMWSKISPKEKQDAISKEERGMDTGQQKSAEHNEHLAER